MIGSSDDKTNLPHKLIVTNRQNANLGKDFANYLSSGIKLSVNENVIKKNVIKPLAKSVLILLGLTAAASAANAGIHKKF